MSLTGFALQVFYVKMVAVLRKWIQVVGVTTLSGSARAVSLAWPASVRLRFPQETAARGPTLYVLTGSRAARQVSVSTLLDSERNAAVQLSSARQD